MNPNVNSADELVAFSRDLFAAREHFNCLEDAAQFAVREIYETFSTRDGDPLFSLARVFYFMHYNYLAPELQTMATEDADYWLALMGTWGDCDEWRQRRLSVHHQIVAPSQASPMFRASFQALGLTWGEAVYEAPPSLSRPQSMTQCFHVPEVLGCRLIPDQERFVEPFGIESVLGLGSSFSLDAGCLALFFAREHIDADAASRFAQMAPWLLTMFSSFNSRLWC